MITLAAVLYVFALLAGMWLVATPFSDRASDWLNRDERDCDGVG